MPKLSKVGEDTFIVYFFWICTGAAAWSCSGLWTSLNASKYQAELQTISKRFSLPLKKSIFCFKYNIVTVQGLFVF